MPEDLDSRLRIANCIYLQGDPWTAISQYNEILLLNPALSSAWYNLSYIQLEELSKTLQIIVERVPSESPDQRLLVKKALELLETFNLSSEELDV